MKPCNKTKNLFNEIEIVLPLLSYKLPFCLISHQIPKPVWALTNMDLLLCAPLVLTYALKSPTPNPAIAQQTPKGHKFIYSNKQIIKSPSSILFLYF